MKVAVRSQPIKYGAAGTMSNESGLPNLNGILLEVASELLYKDNESPLMICLGPPMPNGKPFPQIPPLPFNMLNSIGYL